MKKLFWDTAELDARAVSEFGLSTEVLMQNAANALARAVRSRFKKSSYKRTERFLRRISIRVKEADKTKIDTIKFRI